MNMIGNITRSSDTNEEINHKSHLTVETATRKNTKTTKMAKISRIPKHEIILIPRIH